MAVLPSLPFVPNRYFDNSGNILSGGKLYFYAAGTTTPKDTYQDYQGTTPNANPVVLDSSGHAVIFLGDGLYKVELRDANDVVLASAIDGIGGSTGSGTAFVVATYDDLRALDDGDALAVVVLGRTVAGDGGAGLFTWDQDETAADDFGSILAPVTTPVSGRWARVRGDALLYQWWGVGDGIDDEATALALAFSASAARKTPLALEDVTVRIASNVTVPAGAVLKILDGAQISGGSPGYKMTLDDEAWFEGSKNCFTDYIGIEPGFAGKTLDYIDPDWWDVATDSNKLSFCTTYLTDDTPVRINRRYNLDTSYTQPDYAILDFVGEGSLVWGAGNFTNVIKRWTGSADVMRFRMDDLTLGTLTLSNDQGTFYSPVLFGGEDHIARAFQHGWVYLDAMYDDPGNITTFTNTVYLRGFQQKESASTASSTWAVSGWAPLEDGPSLRAYQFGSLICENIAIVNKGTAANASCRVIATNVFEAKNCALFARGKTAPSFFEGILFESLSGVVNLYDVSYGNVGFTSPIGRAERVIGSEAFYTYPTTETFQGTAWLFYECSIGQLADGLEVVECRGSTITDSGRLSILSVQNSTIAAEGYTTASNIILEDSDLGSGPIYMDDPAATLTASGSKFNWNGIGVARISTPHIDDQVTNSTLTKPCYLPAVTLNGIHGPRTRFGVEPLAAEYISTTGTAGWAFSTAPTSVVSDSFYWDGSTAATPLLTLTRTITTTSEKLVAAYGGTVTVQVTVGTAGAASSVDQVQLEFGEHLQTIDGPLAAGVSRDGDSWLYLFPVWPGADSTVTDFIVRLYGVNSDIDECTVKVTLWPAAPKTQQQWQTFWNWQDSTTDPISIAGSRFNVWRETFAENPRLDLWCEEMPAAGIAPYYTPRPETTQPWLPLLTTKSVYIWPMATTYQTPGAGMGAAEITDTGMVYTMQGGAAGFSVLRCGYVP